jgi:gamma-glutamyl-gamma-aminobutyrate hydrolase PuuD
MSTSNRKVVIGLSPRLLRQVPSELGFRGKTLQYLEESMAHCVMRQNAVVVMVPTVERSDEVRSWQVATADYVALLDGLILQGGADIDPTVYGEEPGAVLGPTDSVRDRFELELLRGFVAAGKPVLGVCRGMQLINVACGGTLYQDLPSAGLADLAHRVADLYDEHTHRIELAPGGWLQGIYGGAETARVNSIHHQGIKRLGDGLVVEARAPDGVIECVRMASASFVVGVQWHPEFHDERFPALLPSEPLLRAFLEAARSSLAAPQPARSDVRRAMAGA